MTPQERFGALTADQVAQLDAAAVASGVDVLQLMEIAGLQVARCAWSMLNGEISQPVSVFCGSGNNGGDGAVAARFLATWGVQVFLHALLGDKPLEGVLGRHLTAATASGVEVMHQRNPTELSFGSSALLIDAVLGTGLHSPPRGLARGAIRVMSKLDAPILSVDVPSGLDATTGEPLEQCVQATRTLTLGAVKAGLWSPAAAPFRGELVVADIGIPAAAWSACGLRRPPGVVAGELVPVPTATG